MARYFMTTLELFIASAPTRVICRVRAATAAQKTSEEGR
jgi:hypothetical protein